MNGCKTDYRFLNMFLKNVSEKIGLYEMPGNGLVTNWQNRV